MIPGTDEYADAHRGCLTFMVPDGTGSAFVQTETEPGCQLRMRVMGDGSESVSSKDFADGMMERSDQRKNARRPTEESTASG